MDEEGWSLIPEIVFYSSGSGNTERFVKRLGMPAKRIPISPKDPMPKATGPIVLICPTYSDGMGRGAVPKQVIRFLNASENRAHLWGVIGAGNRSFGSTFAISGDIIAHKCGIPLLDRFELAGFDNDIARISAKLIRLGEEQCLMKA